MAPKMAWLNANVNLDQGNGPFLVKERVLLEQLV
jgi:hypothetical protein